MFLRGVVRLYRLCDDGARRVAVLVVLTLRRYRPRHVTTRHQHSGQNNCHNQKPLHVLAFFKSGAKILS